MTQDNQPIVVNLPEGQNTLTLMQGTAPKQLDQLAPVKFEASGIIDAPLEFLKKRVGDIDQHKARILVNRDALTITLIFNEDDPYTQGKVIGTLRMSTVFVKFGINTDKQWEPEQLGQFSIRGVETSFSQPKAASSKVSSRWVMMFSPRRGAFC